MKISLQYIFCFLIIVCMVSCIQHNVQSPIIAGVMVYDSPKRYIIEFSSEESDICCGFVEEIYASLKKHDRQIIDIIDAKVKMGVSGSDLFNIPICEQKDYNIPVNDTSSCAAFCASVKTYCLIQKSDHNTFENFNNSKLTNIIFFEDLAEILLYYTVKSKKIWLRGQLPDKYRLFFSKHLNIDLTHITNNGQPDYNQYGTFDWHILQILHCNKN